MNLLTADTFLSTYRPVLEQVSTSAQEDWDGFVNVYEGLFNLDADINHFRTSVTPEQLEFIEANCSVITSSTQSACAVFKDDPAFQGHVFCAAALAVIEEEPVLIIDSDLIENTPGFQGLVQHELTHVRQVQEGRLVINNGYTWDGVEYSAAINGQHQREVLAMEGDRDTNWMIVQCRDLPWELQAYGEQFVQFDDEQLARIKEKGGDEYYHAVIKIIADYKAMFCN